MVQECRLIQPELVLYHFGTVTPTARESIEHHLLSCRECLEGYLALKRHLESEDESAPRPSPAARARLHATVEREFGRRRVARPAFRRAMSWGVAIAAAAVLAALALQTAQPPRRTPSPIPPDGIPVDSANPGAAGLSIL